MTVKCNRCNKEVSDVIKSAFNTQYICVCCKKTEVNHEMFDQAVEKEQEELFKGNYLFEGIGLPEDIANCEGSLTVEQ